MTLIDKAFFLKKTPLFGTLDLNLLLPIADQVGMMEFKPQELIFNIGDEGSRLYFIVKGIVEIYDEAKRKTNELSPPEFFGDESIFNEYPRTYTALSRTDTQILTLSRTHLLAIISESPDVSIDLLKVYASGLSFRPRKNQEMTT